MMSNLIQKLSIVVLSATVLSQCLFVGHFAGNGPVGALYQQTTVGTSGNNLSIPVTRTGKACTSRILIPLIPIGFTWGDAKVSDAAAEGGVTRISTVDLEQFNVLTVYSRQCTVVKGDDATVKPGTNTPAPGFSDTVIMRDGTVHSGVKTIVQGTVINIIKPSGQTLTVPKDQVRTIRKGR
ncbi:MAG: hypothetical protein KDK23_05335 [Leptospiraceae bacterium]|nr:hypothetical protein [Leptospiraceae bacterium]MCB1167843.1 hypothetical protein [Leptospiraceae bacterium]